MFWVDIGWSCVRRGEYKWVYASNLRLLKPDKQSLWNLSFKNKLKNIFSYHSYYHPSIDVYKIFQRKITKHFNAFTEWYIQMMSYDFNNFRVLSNDFLRLFYFESFRKKDSNLHQIPALEDWVWHRSTDLLRPCWGEKPAQELQRLSLSSSSECCWSKLAIIMLVIFPLSQ